VKTHVNGKLKDGSKCKVVEGTHAGKSGIVRDVKKSKTGHVTITVVQALRVGAGCEFSLRAQR
jgi:ribosomal protein S4E